MHLKNRILFSNGKQVRGVLISTVRLTGRLYGTGEFETMVFPIKKNGEVNWGEVYCNRYDSELEATEGHAETCQGVLNGTIG